MDAPAASAARSGSGDAPAPLTGLTWRVLRDPPASGPRNMAADHALARLLRPSEAVLRLYRWKRPTVSLGRNEPARGLYDRYAAHASGTPFVRRPTGGRAVLHDRELTYAVAAPLPRAGMRRVYRALQEALAEGLRSLGVGARTVGRGGVADRTGPAAAAGSARGPSGSGPGGMRALPPDAGPCFAAPSEGEVVVGGRKLVGSAQARLEGALLQHGSILLAGSQEALGGLRADVSARSGGVAAGMGSDDPAPGAMVLPTTVERELGRIPRRAEVEEALIAAFRSRFGGRWSGEGWRDEEREEARRLEARYLSEAWTWRR